MPDPAAPPLLIDRTEAARLLSCCARTVDALIREGKLRPVRLGRRVLIDRADLIQFIQRTKSAAPIKPALPGGASPAADALTGSAAVTGGKVAA